MVKTIKKTYSVGNDKVTRAITLSEESPTSQSSESEPYDHPPLMQPPTPHQPSPNPAPVRYGFLNDAAGVLLNMAKEMGIEKFCGACDLMKKMGFLASPTAESGDQSSYTKVGYNGIYGGGNPDSIMPCTKVGYDVVCPDGIYYRVPMVMPDYPEDYI